MSNSTSHRILGIDPGTALVGWGIIDISSKDDSVRAVAYGHISTDQNMSDEARLDEIAQDISAIITTHKPTEVAIEALFFF